MSAQKANSRGAKKVLNAASNKAVKSSPAQKRAKSAVPKKVVKKAAKTRAKKVSKKVASKKQESPSGILSAATLRKRNRSTDDSARQVALEHLFKKNPGNKKDDLEQSLKLPAIMSLRAISKTRSIATLLSDETVERVRKGAYGLSFAFVLLGSFFSLQELAGSFISDINNSAALTNSTVSSPPALVSNTVLPPSFVNIEPISGVLETSAQFHFELNHAKAHEVLLVNLATQQKSVLATEKVSDNKFKILIPADQLESGNYRVKLVAKGLGDFGEYVFSLGSFEVPVDEVEKETTDTESETDTASDRVSEEDATEEEEDKEPVLMPEDTNTGDNFSLFISQQTFSAPSVIYLQASKEIKDLVVYRRRENSFSPILVGKARYELGSWRLLFDINNVPNGTYELFAKGNLRGIEIESKAVRIEVNKPALETNFVKNAIEKSTEPLETTESEEVVTENTQTTSPEPLPPREFSELSLAPTQTEASGTQAEKIVTEYLRNRKSSLAVLFRNYSVAMQSGDDTAVALAKEALKDEQRVLLDTAGQNTSGVEKEVADRFASLQNRIDTFEELRRSANDGLTSMDSDGDGISDFDERALFKTDPHNPDTDDDGITDGIEIMRGYNPTDAVPEAVLLYESPRETIGLTQDETLLITEVSPIVEVLNAEDKVVQSRITGRGLPNSYVTLYIFSNPTIVTVKTDETGSFSYVFEKELEDGAHEVYVAITDNSGEIIAQSNPFSFVKEAEAYTTGITPTTVVDTTDSVIGSQYNVTFGLAVLALGLILLMLGIGLRSPVVSVEAEATT